MTFLIVLLFLVLVIAGTIWFYYQSRKPAPIVDEIILVEEPSPPVFHKGKPGVYRMRLPDRLKMELHK